MVGTDTMTEGETVEYFVDCDDIVVVSNLAKNEIRLNREQAINMICGLSNLVAKINKKEDLP